MKKRILSVLLCLVMVLGLFPTVSFAAGSGSGATEDDPIVVSTFGDLKSVLEDNSDISMKYIKVAEGTTIDVCPEIESYSSAISVRGFKTLIVDGSVAVYGAVGSDIALDCLLSMNGAGSYLNLKGSGSLTFYGNGSGASNAVVRVENQATLNVSGGITLTGSFNAATYGIAVWNDGGYVTIDGAQLKGRMAVSKGPWGGAVYALSGTTSIKNATLESEFVAGGTNNTDNEQGSVYVSRDATLTIEESTIKATTNNEDGYSIYLGQHNTNAVSNYLATNQKVYKLSDYTQLDANVASLKEDILISNREPSYVNLTIKDRANRTTIADLEPTDITPGGVVLERFVVFEGLNQSSGSPIDHTVAYDGDKNYTVGYQLVTVTGFAFADGISTDDVSVSNGEIFDVKSSGGKLIVYVNFPLDEVNEVNLTFKNKQLRSSLEDLNPTDCTPKGLEVSEYQVYDGLNQTGGTQASTYDNTKDYSAVYTINATTGFAFAASISTDDVTAIGGKVWKVERSNEKTLKVYVNFQAVIDQVSLTIKDRANRTTIADLEPTDITPGGVVLERFVVFEGLNQSSGTPIDHTVAYDGDKNYTVGYQLVTVTGLAFADGISTDDVSVSNGEIFDVKSSGGKLIVYVNFPADTPTPSEYNITVTNGTASVGAGSAITKAEPGTVVTITADAPAEGKVFDKWVVNSGTVTINDAASATTTFTMPAGDVNITATYVDDTTVVNRVSMIIINKSERTTIADLEPTAYTPYDKLTYVGSGVYEGLNKEGGNGQLSGSAGYDDTKDYSAIYLLQARSGYNVAASISKEDVNVINGNVWKVNRSGDGNLLFVCVNFPADTPTPSEYNITVTNGTASVGAGSAITKAEPGTVVTITADAPAEGKVFDKWVVNSGTVTINDAASATTTFTMPAGDVNITATYVDDTTVVNRVSMIIINKSERTTIADLEPTAYTPYDKLTYVGSGVYEGLNKEGGNGQLSGSAGYDDTKDYSAIYLLQARSGYNVAASISKEDVNVINGTVWKVDRSGDGALLFVCVNFPADTPTPSECNITVTNGTASVGAGAAITKAASGTVVTITADAPAEGKVFDKWVVNSGTVTINDAASATTTFTMPAGDVNITATYKDAGTTPDPVTTYALTIVNGTGSGNYEANATVNITAATPEAGKVFDKWVLKSGDATIADVSSASTTVTTKAGAATIEATYKDAGTTPDPVPTYALTVVNGTGSGSYAANATVNITADTPATGKVFDKWVLKSGDATIADVNSASTTVTTKAGAATIEATYKDAGTTPDPVPTYALTVVNGTGSGSYEANATVNITAATPEAGKVFDKWVLKSGDATIADVSSASTTVTTKAGAATIEATYKDAGTTPDPVPTYALTVVNGTGSGSYAANATVNITADTPATGKVFDKWVLKSGDATIADVNSVSTTVTTKAGAATIEATYKDAGTTPDPVPTYALTVVNGTGSGSYEANATVNITAATPEAGKVFDKWVLKSGDATIANVNSASTTVTTKAGAATIEATYKDESVTPTPEYKIIEGANGKWTQKSGTDLKFKANGELSKFIGVKVDGTLLSSDKYTAVSGSTVVTLKDAYLSTLSVGKHTLTVVYNDGECSTEFEIKAASNNGGQTGGNTGDKDNSGNTQSPQTGDSSNLMGWIAALFVSGGALAVTGVVGKRKKKEEVE